MSLSPAFLDELRARTSLSGLIRRAIKLTKAGREEKGCCPFHQEKSASFYVNDDKGFYHCFGCAAHGDAIRWMTEHEGLPFIDAVKHLAAAAGMEMPARDARHAEKDRERDEMLAIMGRAAAWYAEQLWSGSAAAARAVEYVRDRGIVARGTQFNVGFSAPGLRAHLRDVSDERLIALGLLRRRDDDSIGEFFRNRIMFPIRDQRGRTIAFGGRVLGDAQPKYLNSPDTPVFDKGRTLFNIDRAGPAARAAKRLVVVEGYMDVIGLSTVGLDEAVAPNGTALTEDQIVRLWRLAPTPILCFDGDKAGRAAAVRAAIRALPLLEPDKSLSFVFPPAGKDPDDVARDGRDAVEAMLGNISPLVDVLWQHEVEASSCTTPEEWAGLEKRLRNHAGEIRNRSVASAYLEAFGTLYRGLKDRIRPAKRPAIGRATERPRFSRPARLQSATSKAIGRGGMATNVERAVLAGMLRHPDVDVEAASAARFEHDAARELRDVIIDASLEGRAVIVPAHLERAAEYARTGPLRFSFTTDGADPEQAHQDLADALYQLRR